MLERVMHNRFFRGTALFVRRYFDHRVGPAVAKAVAEAARRTGVARI